MNKRYWFVILTYILMQLSSIFIAVPLLQAFQVPVEEMLGLWSVITFSITFVIIVLLLIPDIKNRHSTPNRSTRSEAALWTIVGIFMAFAAQYIAATIEFMIFGIEPGSANTEIIVESAKLVPSFIIVIAIIGPILEEIVFRMIIFGALYQKFNFWIAATISALIFAFVHADFTHTLIYAAVGFVFAFLYVKTKRILVPILAHVSINSFVVLVQIIFYDEIQELLKILEQSQQFIGGFFYACIA